MPTCSRWHNAGTPSSSAATSYALSWSERHPLRPRRAGLFGNGEWSTSPPCSPIDTLESRGFQHVPARYTSAASPISSTHQRDIPAGRDAATPGRDRHATLKGIGRHTPTRPAAPCRAARRSRKTRLTGRTFAPRQDPCRRREPGDRGGGRRRADVDEQHRRSGSPRLGAAAPRPTSSTPSRCSMTPSPWTPPAVEGAQATSPRPRPRHVSVR